VPGRARRAFSPTKSLRQRGHAHPPPRRPRSRPLAALRRPLTFSLAFPLNPVVPGSPLRSPPRTLEAAPRSARPPPASAPDSSAGRGRAHLVASPLPPSAHRPHRPPPPRTVGRGHLTRRWRAALRTRLASVGWRSGPTTRLPWRRRRRPGRPWMWRRPGEERLSCFGREKRVRRCGAVGGAHSRRGGGACISVERAAMGVYRCCAGGPRRERSRAGDGRCGCRRG